MPSGLRVIAQHRLAQFSQVSGLARQCLRLATMLAALAFWAPVPAQDKVTLNFTNTEIEAVVRAIGQFTGKVFVVDPRIKGTLNLTIEQPLSADQAMAALSAALRLQGVVLVESGGVVRVVPEADAKLQGGTVQSGRPDAGRGDELVTQVFRLNYAAAASVVPVLRPLIAPNNTISAYPANNTIVVTDFAENVRRIARIIAAIDTPAGSDIEIVRLQHAIASDLAVLLGRMLDQAAQGADPSQRVSVLAEPTSNSLLIRSASPARTNLVRTLIAKLDQPTAVPGNIHVVYLKNAEATRLARTLLGMGDAPSGALSQSTTPSAFQTAAKPPAGSLAPSLPAAAPAPGAVAAPMAPVSGQAAGALIQADPATNTLIITAPDAVYRQLRVVIDKLDVRRAQVFIESLIVEVTGDQAAEFGIQWQTGGQHLAPGASTGAVGGTNFGTTGQNIIGIAANPATAGTGLNIGIARGQITLPGVGTVTSLQFLARALEQNNKANILSTPNLLTLDNEEARIMVGQNVPFITGQFVTSASGGAAANVNPFQTIERRDVGLTLRVRPQISEGGSIKLVIYQEVSSVQSTTSAGPVTNMRAIESNVLVDDGSIVVLGGLVQDNVTTNVEKVPVLGDIPVLGQFFRYETRRQVKTNLMVFLRPFVVRDESTARSLVVDRYDQMRQFQEGTKQEPHPVLPQMQNPLLPPLPPESGAKPPATPRGAPAQ
ncbi:MAG TPA: type II secretion system secretin GspD [Burkholderiales bacterium]|nr:type II secretion system secretin GspD [Burkholderiales bacterium]